MTVRKIDIFNLSELDSKILTNWFNENENLDPSKRENKLRREQARRASSPKTRQYSAMVDGQSYDFTLTESTRIFRETPTRWIAVQDIPKGNSTESKLSRGGFGSVILPVAYINIKPDTIKVTKIEPDDAIVIKIIKTLNLLNIDQKRIDEERSMFNKVYKSGSPSISALRGDKVFFSQLKLPGKSLENTLYAKNAGKLLKPTTPRNIMDELTPRTPRTPHTPHSPHSPHTPQTPRAVHKAMSPINRRSYPTKSPSPLLRSLSAKNLLAESSKPSTTARGEQKPASGYYGADNYAVTDENKTKPKTPEPVKKPASGYYGADNYAVTDENKAKPKTPEPVKKPAAGYYGADNYAVTDENKAKPKTPEPVKKPASGYYGADNYAVTEDNNAKPKTPESVKKQPAAGYYGGSSSDDENKTSSPPKIPPLKIPKRQPSARKLTTAGSTTPPATQTSTSSTTPRTDSHNASADWKAMNFKTIVAYFLLPLICQIEALHARNILHLDLKPSNMMWDPKKLILTLCDFGLAVKEGDKIMIGGQLQYSPPELLNKKTQDKVPATKAIDMYMFALCAAEMSDCPGPVAERDFAFKLTTGAEKRKAIAAVKISFEELDADKLGVPPEQSKEFNQFKQFLYRCIDDDPAKRPSATEGRTLLAQFLNPHQLAEFAERQLQVAELFTEKHKQVFLKTLPLAEFKLDTDDNQKIKPPKA